MLYACSVILLLLGGLWLVQNASDSARTDDGSIVYQLSQDELQQQHRGETIRMTSDGLVSVAAIESKYQQTILRELPTVIAIVTVVTVLLSLAFWLTLRAMSAREFARLAAVIASGGKTASVQRTHPNIEQSLQHIQAVAEQQLKEYTRLHAYITHEQKNLLALLRSQLEQQGDDATLTTVDRLSSAVDDILTLSESDTRETEVVDVALVVADVVDSYKAHTPKLVFTFDEKTPLTVHARKRWIYRAVANLVDNAVKYGLDKPISVQVTSQHGSIIITVADRGEGISPHEQERIFDNRYRVNELRQDGYGIGLSLVSHVCDLVGGVVYVTSRKGRGSTFYMSLPASE